MIAAVPEKRVGARRLFSRRLAPRRRAPRRWNARPAPRLAGRKLVPGFFRSRRPLRARPGRLQVADPHRVKWSRGYETAPGCTVAANSAGRPLTQSEIARISTNREPRAYENEIAGFYSIGARPLQPGEIPDPQFNDVFVDSRGYVWVRFRSPAMQDLSVEWFTILTLKGPRPVPTVRAAALPTVRAVAATEGKTITLYRAVKPEELADIAASGALRNPVGNEVKYFSTTAEGAASYAQQAGRAFGDGPYVIIKTEVPAHLVTPEMRAVVDRGIQTVVVPTEVLPHMARPVVVPTPAAPVPKP